MTPAIIKPLAVLIPGSAFLAVLQAVTPADVSLIASIERLGVVGVLIIAVVFLARALVYVQKKRDEEREADHKAAMAAQAQMTAALTSNTEMMHGVKEVVARFVTVRDAMEVHEKRSR